MLASDRHPLPRHPPTLPMHRSTRTVLMAAALLAAVLSAAKNLAAQNPAPARAPGAQRRPPDVPLDSARVRLLYVSNRPTDIPKADYERQIAQKRATDSIYAARSAGVMEFRKITYKSRADGMEIPAYLFAPLNKRGAGGHAAMVWVHGGVHGDWGTSMYPFVREAVQRGYVIITPDYRGSTGHGAAMYEAIDYGGKEDDDVNSAVDYLKTMQ